MGTNGNRHCQTAVDRNLPPFYDNVVPLYAGGVNVNNKGEFAKIIPVEDIYSFALTTIIPT
jgi:homoserine kinase